jgi:UDP-3-O-[3-hydroxymyristoyl] glucosamine N-acyltransferase
MKKITLSAREIAEIAGGEIKGDPERTINGVASIVDATPEQLSFVGQKRYEKQLETTHAGIVLVCPDLANAPCDARTLIVCRNVDYSFGLVLERFAEAPPAWQVGVHPSAVVSPEAKLGAGVSINANAVIEAGATIGDGTVIGAGCYIGHDVKIGAKCLIYPNVTIMYRCELGSQVVIHPGVVVGGDGFGFVPTEKGLVKVPQTGIVVIGDDVEIGANTTIDRARFGCTRIGRNVKIDNQVMVAHNVEVGDSSILVAQCGIAGSARLGRGVILAAKAGVNGHITLGDGVKVAGTSGVLKSVPAGQVAMGTPAETQREYMMRYSLPSRFEKLSAKVAALTKELEALKSQTK